MSPIALNLTFLCLVSLNIRVSFMHCIDQFLKFKLKILLNTVTDASGSLQGY